MNDRLQREYDEIEMLFPGFKENKAVQEARELVAKTYEKKQIKIASAIFNAVHPPIYEFFHDQPYAVQSYYMGIAEKVLEALEDS